MAYVKRVYLIERPLTPTEEEGFIMLLRQQEADVFLRISYPVLEKAGAKPWSGLSAAEVRAANERLLRAVNELGHLPVKKKAVADLLTYSGFPSWYYHKFRINFGLQAYVQALEVYRILGERYDRITVYTDKKPPVTELVQQIGGLMFITNAETQPVTPSTAKVKAPLLPQVRRMAKRFAAGAKQTFNLKEGQAKHLFVLNNAHVRPILDPDNLPNLYLDHVFVGYFLREHAHRFTLVDKLLLEKGSGTSAAEEDGEGAYYDRPLQFNEWIEGTALLNPLILWRVWRFHRHLAKAYSRILRSLKDPLHRLIFLEFRKLHHSSLYFFFIYCAYRQYFSVKQFESVTLLDEYSPNFRAIIDAAKQAGIRTQAIQHGSLAASNPGYGYSALDKRFDPWPDRTLVWGQYWKDLLVDIAAYPEERLFVCGQIRTDVIPALLQTSLPTGKILGEQTLGKFLILFATQPQPDEALRKQAALDVFRVAKTMPDAWVVVKPHPRERDLSYYKELAMEAGCSNYSFHYDADLFLLLRLCHVLVHCYSTVGVEAVYFDMPAIILDYLQQDILKFAAEGVALQVQNAQELEHGLQKIKLGEWMLDDIKKQAYIRKYACAIDGRVGERTAQALLSATALPVPA